MTPNGPIKYELELNYDDRYDNDSISKILRKFLNDGL